ncbi:MAG: M1 family metallopeptidase [Bacteroidota bacterium]
MKQIRSLLYLLLLTSALLTHVAGQDHHKRFEAIDVLNYRFEIDLNDTTDVVRGRATVEILFKSGVEQFYLDLTNKNRSGFGMVIEEVLEDGLSVQFVHQNDRIDVANSPSERGITRKYQITYQGIPGDGLIISENRFGDRTFFGDNWPNRAHHWLPVVDHPSDKALVEFLVHAPEHYGVVANGSNINEQHDEKRILSHWQTTVPLSTKLMVIGVSPFAIQHLKSASGIPVSTWVFPQNREEGFYDYSIATRPLDFFESYIAPYPYSKLANVQSKTVYGGMENASCIFYRESTVTGKQEHEKLFAHEIAHQWFGDAVSEFNWHHIWISEGFATYLTDLYLEHTHGREIFVSSMQDERNQVLRYSKRRLAPIVDTSLTVSVRLLNDNSYKKAGWVLHMVRRELGDELFRQSVRTFYEKYKFSNALTEDFQKIAESVSGKDFSSFFYQWFHQPGHPKLSASWKQRGQKIKLTITQHQEHLVFEFPLDIEIRDGYGDSFRETLTVDKPVQSFTIRSPYKAKEIILDPDTWLLFEEH